MMRFDGVVARAGRLNVAEPPTAPTRPRGSASGLRARGALTVDLSWKDETLERCTLSAARSGHWLIRSGRSSYALSLQAGRTQTLKRREGALTRA